MRRHDVKVTCITEATLPTYQHCGKPKRVNPIGHLYTCHDSPADNNWSYQGTVCPRGTLPSSVPREADGPADQQCPGTPPSEEGAHIILWLFPLAFAADTEPKGLECFEELSNRPFPGFPDTVPDDPDAEMDEEEDDDQPIVAVATGGAIDTDVVMAAPDTPSTISAPDPTPAPGTALDDAAPAPDTAPADSSVAADATADPDTALVPVSPKEETDDTADATAYMAFCSGEAGIGAQVSFAEDDPPAPQSKPYNNIGVFSPCCNNLKKLSRVQSQRLVSNVTEMVAADEILKAIVYNSTMSDTQHLIKHSSPCVQALSELIAARQAGPPGLVVVRLPTPTEEVCLELECLADVTNVPIILVSPIGYPTLEDSVTLRGDLSISGIGPEVNSALSTLQTWSESYGYIPRSYTDTNEPDFWVTCNDISEKYYIDAFSRTCFAGDAQDTDPEGDDEEAELVPDAEMNPGNPGDDDDGGGALTPDEREQLILEQFPFPGTPSNEAERRAAWRTIPQRVRVAIRRLHRSFGHLPNKILEQILKQARASKEFIEAARLYRCKVCLDTAPVPRHHPVTGDSLYPKEFNHTVGMDALEIKDFNGVRYTAINIVDMGTNFQQLVLVKTGGGNPSARQCVKALTDRWVSWAGHPRVVATDRGTHFKGEFAQYLSQNGIAHKNAPLESPQTIGKVERHGGLAKAIIRKVVQDAQPSNIEEMETVVSEAVTTKNELSRHQGFSPAQHVLGKQPRAPGSLLDESESLGTYLSKYDETSPYYLRYKARDEAKKAFIHLDTSRKVAKALQRNAAPIDAEYKIGDLVIYRRDNVPGSTATVWSTVSRVIGREAENAYWILHENIPVLVNARKIRPADEVEVAAHRVLTGEPVLPETIVNGPEQRFQDERTADPLTAPATPRPGMYRRHLLLHLVQRCQRLRESLTQTHRCLRRVCLDSFSPEIRRANPPGRDLHRHRARMHLLQSKAQTHLKVPRRLWMLLSLAITRRQSLSNLHICLGILSNRCQGSC